MTWFNTFYRNNQLTLSMNYGYGFKNAYVVNCAQLFCHACQVHHLNNGYFVNVRRQELSFITLKCIIWYVDMLHKTVISFLFISLMSLLFIGWKWWFFKNKFLMSGLRIGQSKWTRLSRITIYPFNQDWFSRHF